MWRAGGRMATTENVPAPKPQYDTESGLAPPVSFTHLTDQSLIQDFHNLDLKDSENNGVTDNTYLEGESEGKRQQYPLKPYAEDCQHYLRTGTCKFGLHCRFNHPVRGVGQVGKEREKERNGFSEKTAQIECKYYLTEGGCKFGEACRYNHSTKKTEIAPPEFNFLGLPIRLGQKDCPFYMRNGSCGYGAKCWFHHPDPTAVGGSSPYGSTPNGNTVGGVDYSSGNQSGESAMLHLLKESETGVASSSHTISNKNVPFLDNHSFYVHEMHSFPQGMLLNAEQNGYQAPMYPEKTMYPHSALSVNNLMKKTGVPTHTQQIQVEEFPERPGQPDCDYFMKTGDCKYRSACRYHHPKTRSSKLSFCVVSDKGLPLRPGRKICWHYEQYGICKYGHACLFDHPVNHDSSAFVIGSALEPSSGTNAASIGSY